MRAIRYYKFGGPEVLRLEEVEVPKPSAGEVLIRHEIVGVNFADTLQRRGLYARGGKVDFPAIPGLEAAGVIESVGDGVGNELIGSHAVAFFRKPGAYAEYSVLPAELAIPIPKDIPWDIAAAFPIQGMTAYLMLHRVHPVKAGETILIHAVSGGVGLLATQMAKRLGAKVIGTCSSEKKAEVAKKMGADFVIIYTKEDFAQKVREFTDGYGVDLILDSVGKATFEKGLEVLAPFGELILYGSSSGTVDTTNPQLLMRGSRGIHGFWLVTARENPELARETASAVLRMWQEGWLKFTIEGIYSFEEVKEVHRRLENRETIGKLLLKP